MGATLETYMPPPTPPFVPLYHCRVVYNVVMSPAHNRSLLQYWFFWSENFMSHISWTKVRREPASLLEHSKDTVACSAVQAFRYNRLSFDCLFVPLE